MYQLLGMLLGISFTVSGQTIFLVRNHLGHLCFYPSSVHWILRHNLVCRFSKSIECFFNVLGPALAYWGHLHSYHRDVTSIILFYKYFHENCSDEPSTLVTRPHQVKYIAALALSKKVDVTVSSILKVLILTFHISSDLLLPTSDTIF